MTWSERKTCQVCRGRAKRIYSRPKSSEPLGGTWADERWSGSPRGRQASRDINLERSKETFAQGQGRANDVMSHRMGRGVVVEGMGLPRSSSGRLENGAK